MVISALTRLVIAAASEFFSKKYSDSELEKIQVRVYEKAMNDTGPIKDIEKMFLPAPYRWLEGLRVSVRPMITYFFVVLLGVFLFHGKKEYFEMIVRLNYISLGFWFGERAIVNLVTKMKEKK